jgi:hypothetical protein
LAISHVQNLGPLGYSWNCLKETWAILSSKAKFGMMTHG